MVENRSPNFAALRLYACPRSRNAAVLKDQRNLAILSVLCALARARGAGRNAIAPTCRLSRTGAWAALRLLADVADSFLRDPVGGRRWLPAPDSELGGGRESIAKFRSTETVRLSSLAQPRGSERSAEFGILTTTSMPHARARDGAQ